MFASSFSKFSRVSSKEGCLGFGEPPPSKGGLRNATMRGDCDSRHKHEARGCRGGGFLGDGGLLGDATCTAFATSPSACERCLYASLYSAMLPNHISRNFLPFNEPHKGDLTIGSVASEALKAFTVSHSFRMVR